MCACVLVMCARVCVTRSVGLTGAVSELEAYVRASEHVHGDGQLDLLAPARAVVVVEHKRVVLIPTRLSGTRSHLAL